jgi:hypothetical protein
MSMLQPSAFASPLRKNSCAALTAVRAMCDLRPVDARDDIGRGVLSGRGAGKGPIVRRSDALAPLSRDHHHALVVAQRLHRAEAATAQDARDAFLGFWRSDGRRHFEVEEAVLLPAFAPRDAAGEEAVRRVLAEHEDVRARAAALERAGGADLGALRELGALLRDHVRHEERVLFPLIEDALPAPELTRLAAAVRAAEAAPG